MTRDGTVGRFRRNRAKPGVSSGHRSRLNDEDSVRGPHQGQQSTRTAPTGRTHDCKRPLRCTPNDLLPGGGHPHMSCHGRCAPEWMKLRMLALDSKEFSDRVLARRREFITLVGCAAATWPQRARAQQPAILVIGLVRSTSSANSARLTRLTLLRSCDQGFANPRIFISWSRAANATNGAVLGGRRPVAPLADASGGS